MKTVKFFTLGCKVNQYDTQSIRENFLRAGLEELSDGIPADIYVINTCTVTHKADKDSFYFIRRAQRENPKAKIIVTGCLAELDSRMISRGRGVDLVVKNKDKPRIIDLISGKTQRRRPNSGQPGISYFKGHARAFLKIQDGCNNFCSYCKVPLVRGNSKSKALTQIAEETEALVANGFKEIVLTGICLGGYGRDLKPKKNLVDVIEALEKIDGLSRIRLSSIEAGDVNDELIRKMASSGKLCRHLHIPVQSGDNKILKKMNRKYTRRDYLFLIGKLKKHIPGIAITTDALVGFPGETEENFRNTVNLIQEIIPLKTHIFPYSKRPGTAAAVKFKEDINPVILKERIKRLKNTADECALKFKKRFMGKTMNVLVEGVSAKIPFAWEGYGDNYIKALVKSKKDLRNKVVRVRLSRMDDGFLSGVL
jgi:threonylcarbamoyladenosine tRNA methylthiotransferase MtaB